MEIHFFVRPCKITPTVLYKVFICNQYMHDIGQHSIHSVIIMYCAQDWCPDFFIICLMGNHATQPFLHFTTQ